MTDKPRRADTESYWAESLIADGERKVDDSRASDTRSTLEIIAAYLNSQRNDDATHSLCTVHYRGGEVEFNAGIELLGSSDPLERAVGADVLAQLGWQDRAFLDESVDALLGALRDPVESVVESAIFALGHRASARAIEALLPFAEHPSADIRYAVVHGLMRHDTPAVVEVVIRLSGDSDRYVRDWATFTLGSQFESDSPALREALHQRLGESDPEIRGEAFVGLALRRDMSILPAILRELAGDFQGGWPIEAAGLLGNPRLLPALKAIEQRLTGEDAVYFGGELKAAIAACEGRRLEESSSQH